MATYPTRLMKWLQEYKQWDLSKITKMLTKISRQTLMVSGEGPQVDPYECESLDKFHDSLHRKSLIDRHTCVACHATSDSVQACSNCHKAYYCSKECQIKHWREGHKDICKKGSKLPKVCKATMGDLPLNVTCSSVPNSGIGSCEEYWRQVLQKEYSQSWRPMGSMSL